MAITLQCQRCMQEQKVDDDKAGQEVACRICYQPIMVPGGTSSMPTRPPVKRTEAKAKPPRSAETAIKTYQPTALTAKKPPPLDASDRPTRGRDDDDEDDDDDRPRRRTRPITNDSSGLTGLVIGGGIFLVAALLCGGVGFGLFFMVGAPGRRDAQPQMAEIVIEAPPPIIDGGPGRGIPPDDLFKNDFRPRAGNLNPLDPNAADAVLERLRGPKQQRESALRWLTQAEVNHPRRADIAKQLDALVDENRQNPFGNVDFFSAYFRWATKDNVPTLIRLVDNDPQRRRQAMLTLARLKDERGVEPLLRQLAGFFERQAAAEALLEMGPIAEPGVLKYLNDPDGQTRDQARRILERYGTKSDRMLTQSLADLESLEANRRAAALQWLAKCPVDADRKVEVSKALNRGLDDLIGVRDRDLLAALEVWATSENIVPLSKLLTQSQFSARDAIRILGKIQDPESTKAIARGMANFFIMNEARQALRAKGELAEPAVIDAMAMCDDVRALRDYVSLLGEIGTRKRSLPALTSLAMRARQDFLLNTQIQQATKAIQLRGK